MTKARDLANASTALSAVSATELGYLDGVTSAVQTQINTKQAVVSGVDDTELGYLNGVTSAIQTQLNQKPEVVAGKNKIINGDFGVWQRGTSFSSIGYTADRWYANFSGATGSVSRQTFTPGTAPVAGYEGQFFLRLATTVADDNSRVEQKMEDVRTFAGQTVTVSLWAKADSARTITLSPYQSFGSGGSADVSITSQTISVTTAWTNFTKTFAIPSVSGKTIGTGSFLSLEIIHTPNATFTLDIWGVQVESGSVATPFTTATGSIQGELAACQRYYWRNTNTNSYASYFTAMANTSTRASSVLNFPVAMRIAPTTVEYANICFENYATSQYALSAVTLSSATNSTMSARLEGTISGAVAGHAGYLNAQNSTSAYLAVSAEL